MQLTGARKSRQKMVSRKCMIGLVLYDVSARESGIIKE